MQLRELRDLARVTIPALERLAAIVDGNDDMRVFFIEAGGCPRLSQLAASDLEPLKGAHLDLSLFSLGVLSRMVNRIWGVGY